MKMYWVFPEVYIDPEGDRYVNLGQLAKILGKKPEKIWEEDNLANAEIKKPEALITIVPKILVTSIRMDLSFYLDMSGNAFDLDGKPMGYAVNGVENLGDWSELFVPEEWASKIPFEAGFAKDILWEERAR